MYMCAHNVHTFFMYIYVGMYIYIYIIHNQCSYAVLHLPNPRGLGFRRAF